MKTPKEKSIYGEIVASSLTLDEANIVRSQIKAGTVGLWIFVFKNKTASYNVGVQNGWGGELSDTEKSEVKECVKIARETFKKKS